MKNINDNKDFSTLKEIYELMCKELNMPEEEVRKIYGNKDQMYLGYTAEDYIQKKTLWGCTSYAVIYAQMARAKGIPAILVEGVNIDYIKHIQSGSKEKVPMGGHWYVEVYIQGKWYLVNSTTNQIVLDYEPTNLTLPDNNILLRKGMDVYDMTKSKSTEEADNTLMKLMKRIPVEKYETNKEFNYVEIGGTKEEKKKNIFIVGSKKGAEIIRQKRRIQASGSSIDNFVNGEVKIDADEFIVLINLQTDQSYLGKVNQVIPGFKAEVGTVQYQIGNKNYIVIVGRNEEEIVRLIEEQ